MGASPCTTAPSRASPLPQVCSHQATVRHCSLRVLITAAMAWIATKYLVTAALVVVISEVAKRSDRIGSLIAALPLVTVLTLLWLYFEKQPAERITNHAWYTFWYVVPTLPMFLAFPFLHERIGFWATLGVSALITIVSFGVFALVVKHFGIELL